MVTLEETIVTGATGGMGTVIATELASELSAALPEGIASVEAAGAGYLNVRFDRTWGGISLRQRVLFALDAFAHEAAEANYLWDLGYFCRTLHEKLRAKWPGVAPMPFFPAFQVRD